MINEIVKNTISAGKLCFDFLASGDVFRITYDKAYVSTYRPSALAGGVANIYLRISKGADVFITSLYGAVSSSRAQARGNTVVYKGAPYGISYTLRLDICSEGWFWTFKADAVEEDLNIELFYGQDVYLNYPYQNEAYISQYIDHEPRNINGSFHILSRQNQGPALCLQQGALSRTDGYATDGFDFFGTEYKKTNIPRALRRGTLPSAVYQYEMAYAAFNTPTMPAAGAETVFYALVKTDNAWTDVKTIRAMYRDIISRPPAGDITELNLRPCVNWQNPYPYIGFSNDEINVLFPKRELEEKADGKILSWFSADGVHYITGDKEEHLERPSGHIIINRGFGPVNEALVSSANYIFGVFNSQLCFGNTQFNRLMTYNKTPLNILKTSGQRLFIKYEGEYRLLGLPAVYELDVDGARWYYKIRDDVLLVEAVAAVNRPLITFRVKSQKNYKYDFISTCELALADIEYRYPVRVDIQDNTADFYFSEDSPSGRLYPDYHFRIEYAGKGDFRFSRDEIFFPKAQPAGCNILAVSVAAAAEFTLYIEGLIGADAPVKEVGCDRSAYARSFRNDMNDFHIFLPESNENGNEIKKMNHLAYWYTHNALIHYSAPRGLEQYGGGAWGTRDVCQGPVELFTAFKRYDLVKGIIIKVYGRQFYESGDWPQWFMFDRFRHIQADSSHADIIVWPLYIVGKYINETGDISILREIIPYSSKGDGRELPGAALCDHIERQIAAITENLISGTFLSAYGGGDWNDTLQPKNTERKQKMASAWTVALTIEALEAVNKYLDNAGAARLLKNMKKHYYAYMIKDNIPTGFVQLNKHLKYLLHPSDKETGIHYRLLSFNRGMIAELFQEQSLPLYLDIIDRNLISPDGARLMDNVVTYRGGNSRVFCRAETAANFGREVGLLYVHAHLRYLEAMSRLGEAERFYDGLRSVNPILIKENVKNALTRQSNAYFSSSDAAFKNRYEANRHFKKVRRAEIPVKGGWRLYSSGPGIWLNLIISEFLGIKQYQGELYIDPVLPAALSGLRCRYRYYEYMLYIEYDITGTSGVECLIVNGKGIANNTSLNKYRRSGVIVPRGYLLKETKIIVKM